MKTLELDKTFTSGVGAGECYGTVTIRVVVLPPKENKQGIVEIPDPDEPLAESGSGPLDSYLERPRGEGYVVFLVHGQRHESRDETFVQRELNFKFLKSRTMVIIDVDGLEPEAISELVQGSRQGFYEGVVYGAILDRVIAVLKKDPDLMKLEEDAEQKLAELRAGDEVVRKKLDELIQGHLAGGQHVLPGQGISGVQGGMQDLGSGSTLRDVVVPAQPNIGDPATAPVLEAKPDSGTLVIHPNKELALEVNAVPTGEWVNVKSRQIRLDPATPELNVKIEDTGVGALIKLLFVEPPDFEDENYPLRTKLAFYAAFEGKSDPRVLERSLVIRPAVKRPPPPPVTLSLEPTFLKVVSRKPLKLVPGGPSCHVRLRWDGEDHLASGWPPLWTFTARCLSLESLPAPVFSKPRAGRFELLLDAPHGLLTGQILEFEIEAAGPEGKKLIDIFTGEVVEPPPAPEPRKIKGVTPEGASDRQPPYQLLEVYKKDWDSPCWGSPPWTEADGGCFDEPNGGTPLKLIINKDAAVLQEAREQMIARQLSEETIKEGLGRYEAHIYFHLYKMYEYFVAAKKARDNEEPGAHFPSESELRGEINRVAVTLSSLMDR